MINQITLDVESFFITNEKVYKVFRVEKTITKGKRDRIIHYRPYYLDEGNKTLVCSIPESNISALNPSRPIPKLEMMRLLMLLAKKNQADNEKDPDTPQTALSSNDTYRIVKVLKSLWANATENPNSKSWQKEAEILVKRISEEFALLLGSSREQARDQIVSALSSHSPTSI